MNKFGSILGDIFGNDIRKQNEIPDIQTYTHDIAKLFLVHPRTKNLSLKDDTDVNKCFYQCYEKDNKTTCDMSQCENKLKEILIQEPKVRKFCESVVNDLKEEDKYLQSKLDSFQIFYRPKELDNNEPLDELDIDKLKAFHVINFNRKDSNKDSRSGIIELNPKRLDYFK